MKPDREDHILKINTSSTIEVDSALGGFTERGIDFPRRIRKEFIPGELILESVEFPNTKKGFTESGLIIRREDMETKGTFLIMHPTISINDKIPSVSMFSFEILLACAGYNLIIPDYLGFGSSSDRVHPYIHAQSAASSGLYAYLAAKFFLKERGVDVDNNFFVAGYSEGGHAAMAFQKFFENGEYGKIPIRANFCGAGPFDLVLTVNTIMKSGETGYPYGIVMVPVGIDEGEGLGLDFNNIFRGEIVSNYTEWLKEKRYRTSEVNEMIGSVRVRDFMHEDFFNEHKNSDILTLFGALEKNSVIRDWKPDAPIYILHSVKDDYVPVENSRESYRLFKEMGCRVDYKELKRGSHKEIMIYFLFHIINTLTQISK